MDYSINPAESQEQSARKSGFFCVGVTAQACGMQEDCGQVALQGRCGGLGSGRPAAPIEQGSGTRDQETGPPDPTAPFRIVRRDKHCLSGIRNECNLPEANDDTGFHYSYGFTSPLRAIRSALRNRARGYAPLRGAGGCSAGAWVRAPARCFGGLGSGRPAAPVPRLRLPCRNAPSSVIRLP